MRHPINGSSPMKVILGIVATIITLATVFVIGTAILIVGAIDGAKDCLLAPVNLAGEAISKSQKDIGNLVSGQTTRVDQFLNQFSASTQVEQRKNAALIVKIGQSRPEKFSDRDIAIAVATAIQESNLRNLPFLQNHNDHDSLGLFQQRPSVGSWGTAEQIMDPTHAINAFYDRLAGVANRDKMAMIDVAIKIQIPNKQAYHSRWKWDDIAQAFVSLYKTSGPSTGTGSNLCLFSAGVTPVGTGTAHIPLDPGYHVSDGFADPRPNLNINASKPHIGIDLVYGSNTLGRPVYAAFSGVVVQSGYGGGCNKSSNNPVMILTKEGFETGYLHMNGQQILVKKGDTVTAGQRIGSIGSCGQVTGPHLHFEVTPANDHDAWLSSVKSVQKYGSTWLDPNAVMAHYGVKLLP